MASLLIIGNTNERTFANAALAANERAIEIGGAGLSDVFVLHSPESEQKLFASTAWKEHLRTNGLSPDIFVNCTVDLRTTGAMAKVARHVERFLLPLDKRADVFVDLTNGTSQYKSVLSNIAYVLGVRRQFTIEAARRGDFLNRTEALEAYVELPDPAVLDAVAPAWLTEVRRFSLSASDAARTLISLAGDDADASLSFEAELRNAVEAWFRGAKHDDGSALGGAVRHVGRAFEDLIGAAHAAMSGSTNRSRPLNDALARICAHLNQTAAAYEPELLEDVAQLLRRLRNASTHERTSPDFGRIRARLSTELLLATSEYFRILNEAGLLGRPVSSLESGRELVIHGMAGTEYLFGLDGDDTGRELERLLQGAFGEDSLSRFSRSVDAAMHAVAEEVRSGPLKGQILFCSGDDLLFKGCYNAEAIESLRATYHRVSSGRTCSVGFGKSGKEAYVALKMAKANPGKDSVVGVELSRTEATREAAAQLGRCS